MDCTIFSVFVNNKEEANNVAHTRAPLGKTTAKIGLPVKRRYRPNRRQGKHSKTYKIHSHLSSSPTQPGSLLAAMDSPGNITMAAQLALLDWIKEHPYQTFFHVVNGVVLLTPAAATVPFFSAIGLGAGGPVAGASSHPYPRPR